MPGTRTWIAAVLVLTGAASIAACSSGHASGAAQAPKGPALVDEAAPPRSLAVPSWAKVEHFAGELDAQSQISLQVHLQLRDYSAAVEELYAVSDPDSARYGQYLTTEQFEAKYAPTADDVAAVRAHLESHGLTVGYVPENRMFVSARGTAAQVAKAFNTRLGTYAVGNSLRRAPMTTPSLPDALSGRVLGVLGLSESLKFAPKSVRVGGVKHSDGALRPRHAPKADDPNANACSEWFGQLADTTDPAYFPEQGYGPLTYAPCGYKPAQLRNAYGINATVRKGADGSGATIAIVDAFQSPTLLQDAQTYAANNDPDYPLKASQMTQEMAPGDPSPVDTGWFGEQTLDVESAHGIAPGAKIEYVGAQSANDIDLVAALNLVIHRNKASVISNSYGSIEAQPNDFVIWQNIVVQAGLKGIGVYFSSGDNGDEATSLGFPSADFPASLTNVTAVGGTSLAIGQDGGRIFESGWATGASFVTDADPTTGAPAGWDPTSPGFFVFGAGGGTSFVYAQPRYQKGVVPAELANIPGAPARVVPDVGMLADPITGMTIGQTDPDTGVFSEFAIGGTSLACPLFAGTIAVAESSIKHKLGFANPQLYKVRKKAFRDIVPPKTPQAVALPGGIVTTIDGPVQTIADAPGYDNVTGLGAPNGTSFISALK